MHRKPTPAIFAALITLLVVSCATTQTEPGTAPPTASIGADAPGILLDVTEVANSYPAPENPPDDWLGLQHIEWLHFCTAAFGFESTIVTLPGVKPSLLSHVTGAQRFRFAEVNDRCTAEAVARGWVRSLPTSVDQLREAYERLRQVNECLTELGYGTEPPSEARFLEDPKWNVYANTPAGSQLFVIPGALADAPTLVLQQLEIQEACPTWEPTE